MEDRDRALVGRVRTDARDESRRSLCLTVVGDNLRLGAATNAVRIASRWFRAAIPSSTPEARLTPRVEIESSHDTRGSMPTMAYEIVGRITSRSTATTSSLVTMRHGRILMLALVVHAGGEAPPGTPLEVYRTRSALPPEVAKKAPKAFTRQVHARGWSSA